MEDGEQGQHTLDVARRSEVGHEPPEILALLGELLDEDGALGAQVVWTRMLSLLLGARYDRVAYNYRTFFNPAESFRTETAACESAGNAYEREVCINEHGGPPAGAQPPRP